ncbi:MAG TPA: hypothetical protein VGF74_18835 [Thermoleophilaceae bacterium]
MTRNLTYTANLARLEDLHRHAAVRASLTALTDERPRRRRWPVQVPRARRARRTIGAVTTG